MAVSRGSLCCHEPFVAGQRQQSCGDIRDGRLRRRECNTYHQQVFLSFCNTALPKEKGTNLLIEEGVLWQAKF